MSYYVNDTIKNLNRIFDQNNRSEYLRLDLNENPGGLPAEFVEEVLKDISPNLIAEYPETLPFTRTLAKYINADISNLCLVNGSAEGIRFIIEAFTSPGGKIVGVTPSYAMFEVYSKMYGRRFEPVHYTTDFHMPVENIITSLTRDTELLILVNPNNPLGNAYTNGEFEQILSVAKKLKVTILIDEAYHYFYPNSLMKYALSNEHVFVTRTFSKLFSLAGLRLGYIAGSSKDIETVQKLCTPHNINAVSMLFAQHILETPELIQYLITKHKEGREYLETSLKEHGYEFQGQYGNFIFIQPKRNAFDLVQEMKEKRGILIKCYAGVGHLGNCLRVTTAEKKYMEQFLDALYALDF